MNFSNDKQNPHGIYHVTWVTHNSRIASRSKSRYTVKGILFDEETEVRITEIIAGIIAENRYKVYAYNICKDHIHLLIECDSINLTNSIRMLKGKSAQLYKDSLNIPASQEFHLWAQKFNRWYIETEEQFQNTLEYINNNRIKHQLMENKQLYPYIRSMLQMTNNAVPESPIPNSQ